MRPTTFEGDVVQFDEPEWAPLLATVGEQLVGDFMWMHEVELDDGTHIHAYKHIDTRRYIHLDGAGRAYVYESSDRYRPAPVAEVLTAVFGPLAGLAGVTRAQVMRSWGAVERLDTEA